MMVSPPSVGGVLHIGVSENLHHQVLGRGYATSTQQKARLAQIVKPFTSVQLAAARRVAEQGYGPPPVAAKQSHSSGRPRTHGGIAAVHRTSSSTNGSARSSQSSERTAQQTHNAHTSIVSHATNQPSSTHSSARPRSASAKRSPTASSSAHAAAAVAPASAEAATRSTSAKKTTAAKSSNSKKKTTHSTGSGISTASMSTSSQAQVVRTAPNAGAITTTAPKWIATSVHPPDRPNAPSQQTVEQRAALHKVDSKHAKKSHKLLVQQYPKAFTDATPEQMSEEHALVRIERHARPLVVHPKNHKETPVLKFVPIGKVVAVRPVTAGSNSDALDAANTSSFTQAATPGQKEERHMQFTQPTSAKDVSRSEAGMQLNDPPAETISARARHSFAAMQSDWRPHGLFVQSDREKQRLQERAELEKQVHEQQQKQQHDHLKAPEEEKEAVEQKYSDVSQQEEVNTPMSTTLQTPHPTNSLPQPYSGAFLPQQQQHHQSSHAQSKEHSSVESPAHTRSSSHARSTGTSPAPVNISVPPASHDGSGLLSPSPARTTNPQPAYLHTLSASSSVASLSEEPHSPLRVRASELDKAIVAERDRRTLEREHERAMKSYLSPPASTAGGAAARSSADLGEEGSQRVMRRTKSALFYEAVNTRPADLPPMDPRAGLAVVAKQSLFPNAESDPLRSLAASLRGPRLKYEVPQVRADFHNLGASGPLSPGPDGSLMSPARFGATKEGDEAPLETHEILQREIDESARRREDIAKEAREVWQAKWDRLRQTKQAAIASVREALSPTSASASSRTNPFKDDKSAKSVTPIPPQYSSPVPEPHQRTPSSSSHQTHSQQPTPIVSGGRISDPVLISHAPLNLPHRLNTPQQQPHPHPHSRTSSTSSAKVTFAPDQTVTHSHPHPHTHSHFHSTPAHSTHSAIPIVTPPSALTPRRIIVGSKNTTKVNAVRAVADSVFAKASDESYYYLSRSGKKRSVATGEVVHQHVSQGSDEIHRANEVLGIEVPSGVSAQPLSGSETRTGAINRAKAALASDDKAEFGVGIEGGVEIIDGTYYESGFVAVVDRHGKIGTATSARFEVSEVIARELLKGVEMAEVADRLSGQSDVRSKQGLMGLITQGLLQRSESYKEGVIFAFAPFISPKRYWEHEHKE